VALSAATTALLYRSAIAMARAGGPDADAAEIARRIRGRTANVEGESYLSFFNIAQAAIRAVNAARELSGDPDTIFRKGDLPTDPTLNNRNREFLYRVVVSATNPDDLSNLEVLTVIRSNEALTLEQLEQMAIRAFQRNDLERDYRARVAQFGSNTAYEVFVVSAAVRR